MEQEKRWSKKPRTPILWSAALPSTDQDQEQSGAAAPSVGRLLLPADEEGVIACRRRGGSFTLLLTPTPRPPHPTHHKEEFTAAGGRRCRGSARKGLPPPRILDFFLYRACSVLLSCPCFLIAAPVSWFLVLDLGLLSCLSLPRFCPYFLVLRWNVWSKS